MASPMHIEVYNNCTCVDSNRGLAITVVAISAGEL